MTETGTALELAPHGDDPQGLSRNLVRIYRALYAHHRGDAVALYHWLHRELAEFGATPHRLLVDDHALEALVGYLERRAQVGRRRGL